MDDISRTEPQPLDWVKVVTKGRHNKPRPSLSDSVVGEVKIKLKSQKEEILVKQTEKPPRK